ncbi:MAG TPA: TetR/AcrR family transcriptional regulator [Candidatus Eisenbergiella merdipullorum]|uniref:TetR/AcrR family transcriptional regulator n=1 Tax=Candidatus Eisenbergiella merdipullorum TaxID=2838553 RepID=A0A9D2KYZ2_9FIRM|nr:TetR/AcrR family transcriptional regulator [Candidatus Eisenbergiella merdipullorum]
MNQRFFDVAKEKQDRIINAALRVFALNGYRHAGTDEVVRHASISKGLLFHYFESKLGLYSFIYDYSVRYMLLELSGEIDKTETDLFVLIRSIEEASLRACRQYPYLKAFLDSAREEDCEEALEAVKEPKEQYQKRIDEILKQADVRLLRPKADLPRTVRIMGYTFRGLTREYSRRREFSPEELFGEIFSYLRLFERLFGS